jgi:hypothetical protein
MRSSWTVKSGGTHIHHCVIKKCFSTSNPLAATGRRPTPNFTTEELLLQTAIFQFPSSFSESPWWLAGSNPAKTMYFKGDKNPQHTFLRMGSKAAGPMS